MDLVGTPLLYNATILRDKREFVLEDSAIERVISDDSLLIWSHRLFVGRIKPIIQIYIDLFGGSPNIVSE